MIHLSRDLAPGARIVAASLALLGSPAAQHTGVTWSGDVVAVYPDGQGNVIGSTGVPDLNSMARLADGRLIAVNLASPGHPPRFHVIDPLTGAAEVLGNGSPNDVRALAVSPEGWLYAIDVQGAVNCDLYVIDLSMVDVGIVTKTLIGETTINGLQGMAFAPSGVLYGWSKSAGLVVIDRFTAACTDVNPDVGGSTDIQTIDFGPDGALYALRDALWTIDLATGEPTMVGAGSYADIRGAEFDAASFPTLSATALVAPGGSIALDLQGEPLASYVIGLAFDDGPICPPTLPFCLDLGPSGSGVFTLPLGTLPPGGVVSFDLPTPADPLLSGLELRWQAVTVLAPAGPRKTEATGTTLL